MAASERSVRRACLLRPAQSSRFATQDRLFATTGPPQSSCLATAAPLLYSQKMDSLTESIFIYLRARVDEPTPYAILQGLLPFQILIHVIDHGIHVRAAATAHVSTIGRRLRSGATAATAAIAPYMSSRTMCAHHTHDDRCNNNNENSRNDECTYVHALSPLLAR